jgi:hypothetical protein
MGLREVGFYLRGRVNSGIARALNARRAVSPLVPVAEVDDVIRGDDDTNAIRGESGDDRIEGRGGDDILIGACALVEDHFFLEPPCEDDGSDTLDGGTGTDRCLEGESNTSCELTTLMRAQARRSALIDAYAVGRYRPATSMWLPLRIVVEGRYR